MLCEICGVRQGVIVNGHQYPTCQKCQDEILKEAQQGAHLTRRGADSFQRGALLKAVKSVINRHSVKGSGSR